MLSQSLSLHETLNLTEFFISVQGESTFTGLPTAFIRLSACNLRCTWCDTPYSFKQGQAHSLDEIIKKVEKSGCRHVCLTGGEPLLQNNVYTLMKELCDLKFILSLETGGSLTTEKVDSRVHIILDIKCPESGMNHKNYWPNLARLRSHDEVKFVLVNRSDYQFAKETCKQYNLFGKANAILFSPVHGVLDPKELVKWILEDQLQVRLNLQLHKYIWSPATRGV